MNLKSNYIKVLGALIILISIIGIIYTWNPNFGEEYETYLSPDRKYKIVVYRIPQKSVMMPGQGSDAPGWICLYDLSSGKLLQRTPVEMVQLVRGAGGVRWSSTNVYIKLLVDWELQSVHGNH